MWCDLFKILSKSAITWKTAMKTITAINSNFETLSKCMKALNTRIHWSRIDWRKVVSYLRARSVSHGFWLFCIIDIFFYYYFAIWIIFHCCAQGFVDICFIKIMYGFLLLIRWYHGKLGDASLLFVHFFLKQSCALRGSYGKSKPG